MAGQFLTGVKIGASMIFSLLLSTVSAHKTVRLCVFCKKKEKLFILPSPQSNTAHSGLTLTINPTENGLPKLMEFLGPNSDIVILFFKLLLQKCWAKIQKKKKKSI